MNEKNEKSFFVKIVIAKHHKNNEMMMMKSSTRNSWTHRHYTILKQKMKNSKY